ncbi:predicted protein [Thalassiosira pseudonana CCMP1335]|uniref:Uncharacterized protein n=1 Tax=Thalassiosira pseudonana TaxID=35128 RepID=B5YN12_THAPS|nr:predicted protein [Thalassiosira pseudonana CCMP1335]ACI64553.1 predicted protein [Thalassiosira pseudonana CCMP1335]|eukprot:scaffold11006_cov194-Alexandrium_tamarense.AAC.3
MTPSSSLSAKTTASIASAVILTGVLIHQRCNITRCYNDYRGMQGMLRYIWVGDYLPPSIRQSMDELDKVGQGLLSADDQLDLIETKVQRAQLESVDGPTDGGSDNNGDDLQKQIFQQNPELRKDIGVFSSRLDRLAATIDSVKSHSDEEVKRRKKQMSNKIVTLMTELDRLIASLNLAVH